MTQFDLFPCNAKAVNFIYAKSVLTDAIGLGNKLPWHLPEDLAHFKSKTLNSNVLMGMTTYQNLPPSFKPLPNRKCYVVTRNTNVRSNKKVTYVHDPIDFVKNFKGELWVAGGKQLFMVLEDYCTAVHETIVYQEGKADTYYSYSKPKKLVHMSKILTSANGIKYKHKLSVPI